jgi:hypothetical protein
MDTKRYWFPVRPARDGWGWGLPIAWQGWLVYLIFFVLLIGGSIILPPYGVFAVVANGFVSGGFLLAMAFWKGEPQSMRDNSSP